MLRLLSPFQRICCFSFFSFESNLALSALPNFQKNSGKPKNKERKKERSLLEHHCKCSWLDSVTPYLLSASSFYLQMELKSQQRLCHSLTFQRSSSDATEVMKSEMFRCRPATEEDSVSGNDVHSWKGFSWEFGFIKTQIRGYWLQLCWHKTYHFFSCVESEISIRKQFLRCVWWGFLVADTLELVLAEAAFVRK